MTGARVMLRGLFQRTVWSHYNTANIPDRYQLLYTFVLPFQYIAIFLYGALSISVSVSSIDLIFGNIYGDLWSIGLTAGGLLSLLGVAFYARLIWLEVMANIALVTLMIVYIGCIIMAAVVGAEDFRYLSLTLVILFLPMPTWRIFDIVKELRPARES